jgi:hypothetical protein
MQDGIGAVEGALHGVGIGHVAWHRLDVIDAKRREDARDAVGRPCQDADAVAGPGEGRDRV